jgi:hypothetical protein
MKRIIMLILIGWIVFYLVAYHSVATAGGLENAWDALGDFFHGLGVILGRLIE